MSSPQFRFGLARSIGAVLLQQGTVFLISLLTFGILIRLLGDLVWQYALLIIALNAVSLTGNLGLKKIMVRRISGLHSDADTDDRSRIFWTSFVVGVLPILLLSTLTVRLLSYLNFLDTPNPELDAILLLSVLVISSARYLGGGGMEGLKRFEILSVYVAGSFTLRRLTAIILFPLWGMSGLLSGWLIGEGIGFMLVLAEDLKDFGLPRLPHSPMKLVRDALPLFVSDIADTLTVYGDRIALLVLYPFALLGSFHVAATGIMILDTASTAIYTGSLPHLSETFQEGGRRELVKKVKEIGRYVMLFSAPFGIGGAVLAYPLVTLIAGSSFADAVPIFAVMGVGMWISALGRLFQSSLIAAGLNKEVMYSTILATVIDLLVMAALASQFGFLAAGIARASLFVSSFLLSAYFMNRGIGIETDREAVWKAYLSSIMMGVVVYLFYIFVSSFQTLPIFVALPFLLAVGIVTYVLGLRLFKAAEIDEVAILYNSIPFRSRWIVRLISSVMGLEFSQVQRKVDEMNHQ
ncbi:MAG: polysaccharide biosynthesis C-terminal domain-containing protein [Candidatus Geothermarchaeales archaeon]